MFTVTPDICDHLINWIDQSSVIPTSCAHFSLNHSFPKTSSLSVSFNQWRPWPMKLPIQVTRLQFVTYWSIELDHWITDWSSSSIEISIDWAQSSNQWVNDLNLWLIKYSSSILRWWNKYWTWDNRFTVSVCRCHGEVITQICFCSGWNAFHWQYLLMGPSSFFFLFLQIQ